MSAFKKLASDTALYGGSTILGRLLNWALVFLHTRIFIRPGELASNVEIYTYIGVLSIVYTLGLETAFFRYAARNKDQLQDYYNRSLSIVIVFSVLLSGSFIALAPWLTDLMGYPGQEVFLQWAAAILAIDAITAIPFARLRVENKARRFVKTKITNILINIGLNLFFLILCRDIYNGEYLTGLQPAVDLIYYPSIGPGYIILANLIANAVNLLQLADLFKGFRIQLEKEEVKALLTYAFPLMIIALVGVINQMTDRIFLRHFLPDDFYLGLTSEDVLGIYGNCYKLSVFMALAIQSFKFAADPFFFSRAEDKNAPDLLANVTKWFIIVCVLIWVGVSLNLDVIGLLIGRSYRRGLDVVPVLMLANLIMGVFYNMGFWFKLSDKTIYGTWITVVGTAATIVLNILLIPVIGYMGCALAFLASAIIMAGLCYYLGEKYYPVPYDLSSAIGYIGGGGLLIFLASRIEISNLWMAVPYHVLLFILFVGVVVMAEWKTFGPVLARRGIAFGKK
ncbi:lipopolysaccharide biosynthesis protein [Tellurirhabdus bombi]|uniref:lipopolysaccharide biosynthesis protein n=1 Tax=Tellurirhabdus bombi TaxID=2907205 RepID=UPI001F3A6535|nr:polysaccharide biosynthesis C-terminal domain-containing protein [Tellurirhabdus bombi]